MIGRTAARMLRVLRRTWWVDVTQDILQEPERLIVAFWHGDMIALFACLQGRPALVAHSRSFRGVVIGSIATAFGHDTCSLDGTEPDPLRDLRKALGHPDGCVALAVDGPVGPAFVAKPGAVMLAAQSGARLLPIRIEASPALRFWRRWDTMALPLPFAKVRIEFGPIVTPAGRDPASLRRATRQLTRILSIPPGRDMDLLRDSRHDEITPGRAPASER